MRELTEGHTSQWFNGQGEFLLIVNILMMKLHHDLLRINVETGEDYPETLENVKFSNITWTKDNKVS